MRTRKRYLSVPINNQGIEEYDHGIEDTANIIETLLPENEFYELQTNGVFEQINKTCDLLIDDYESEIITAQNLINCKSIIQELTGVFAEAAHKAIEHGTFLALDF